MSDYISKSEAIHTVTKVELKDGTFAEVKMGIGELPTLDEKEVIRKPLERIVERLEEMTTSYNPYDSYYEENQYRATKFENAIRNKAIEEIKKVIKEEGGIE